MTKNDNYEISDNFLGRVGQYASAVWKSWGKAANTYIDGVMDTDSKRKNQNILSTVVQDAGHTAKYIWSFGASFISNDFMKARATNTKEWVSQTEGYKNVKEAQHKLDETLDHIRKKFIEEHPGVQATLMETEKKLEDVRNYIKNEVEVFVKNHPEITYDIKSIVDIAMILPTTKASKILLEGKESRKLNKVDYTYEHGKTLAKGIPADVDKKMLNLEELAVTAEGKVDDVSLFDVNQKARAIPHPKTPALRHDYIRNEEAKNIAKVERDILDAEQSGKPWTQEKIDKEYSKASKPNAILAESHAETAIIQKAYEQGLTKDAHMFIKVNGKAVCGHCNSDTIAMAKKAGLKSITIHDYNAVNKEYPEKPIIYWEQGMSKVKRFESFEDLKKEYPNAPKVPDHIKYAGIIETEKTQMNSMDYAILGANGALLMQGNESTGDTQAQTPATPKARTILNANNTTRADDIIRADANSQPQSCSLLPPEMRYDNRQIAEFDVDEDENNLTDDELYNEFMDSHGYNIPFPDNKQSQETQADTLTKEQKTLQDLYPHLYQDKSDEDEMDDQNDMGMEM